MAITTLSATATFAQSDYDSGQSSASYFVYASIQQAGYGCHPYGSVSALFYFVQGNDIKQVGSGSKPYNVPAFIRLDPVMSYKDYTVNTVTVTVVPSFPAGGHSGTTSKTIAPYQTAEMHPGPCKSGGDEPETPIGPY